MRMLHGTYRSPHPLFHSLPTATLTPTSPFRRCALQFYTTGSTESVGQWYHGNRVDGSTINFEATISFDLDLTVIFSLATYYDFIDMWNL